MTKRWRVAETCPPDFAAAASVPPAMGQILWNRGLRTPEETAPFFDPLWEKGIHDPWKFRQMRAAIDRVRLALEQHQHITVHGDYDADGITSSALLLITLKEIKKNIGGDLSTIDFYIPHRDKEGYGLHPETITLLKERGTQLIITVDCGIASVEEIKMARALGMDVIVIDHHQFGDVLPDAHLIHPGLPEETYPFHSLAAVGVAFKFACAALDDAREHGCDIKPGWEKWLLDLVAIATVTDMVPLLGENRVLENFGLRVLNKTRRPGLRALIELAGLTLGTMDTESVGFSIGPRLNAAGRMDHASVGVELLLAESEEDAKRLADALEKCNRDRQDTTRRMMKEAEEKLAQAGPMQRVVVLWDERWPPSLVGLLAGKFLDRFGRPAIVIGRHEEKWIGSGRSNAPFDVTNAMRVAGESLLSRVGGHIQACGFALERAENLPLLAERLYKHADEHLREEDLVPLLDVDAEVALEDMQWPLVEQIKTMEPFGEGNRRPMFLARRCFVASADLIGSTKSHLRMAFISKDGRRLKAMAFKMGDRIAEVPIGQEVDIVYHMHIHEWQGRRDLECRIVDFKKSE